MNGQSNTSRSGNVGSSPPWPIDHQVRSESGQGTGDIKHRPPPLQGVAVALRPRGVFRQGLSVTSFHGEDSQGREHFRGSGRARGKVFDDKRTLPAVALGQLQSEPAELCRESAVDEEDTHGDASWATVEHLAEERGEGRHIPFLGILLPDQRRRRVSQWGVVRGLGQHRPGGPCPGFLVRRLDDAAVLALFDDLGNRLIVRRQRDAAAGQRL
jgi:hypothetical protein